MPKNQSYSCLIFQSFFLYPCTWTSLDIIIYAPKISDKIISQFRRIFAKIQVKCFFSLNISLFSFFCVPNVGRSLREIASSILHEFESATGWSNKNSDFGDEQDTSDVKRWHRKYLKEKCALSSPCLLTVRKRTVDTKIFGQKKFWSTLNLSVRYIAATCEIPLQTIGPKKKHLVHKMR